MITIRYSNGTTATATTLQGALATIRETYPEAVAYQTDAGEVGDATTEIEGGRILVWETEEESTDDDGAHAVASLTGEPEAEPETAPVTIDLTIDSDPATLGETATRADLDAYARQLGAEVSALWPDLDHGDGALYTIAREAVGEDPAVTAKRVAEIARAAEADAAEGI